MPGKTPSCKWADVQMESNGVKWGNGDQMGLDQMGSDLDN